MLVLIISLLVITALVGGILLRLTLQDKPSRKWISLIHGTVALIGLLILCAYIADDHVSYFTLGSVALLILGIIGGFTLLIKDITRKKFPQWLVILHPLAGIVAIILLMIFVFVSTV